MPGTAEKPWWQSKTLLGAVVTIACAVASAVTGIEVAQEEQVQIADYGLEIAGAAGGLLAIYGRLTATKRLK